MPAALGVMGGTFDPPHLGHLVVANEAAHQLGLDQVLLVVANQPWHKPRGDVTPAHHRLAMVEAAVAGNARLAASGMEIARGGPSYTADTLSELHELHAGTELVLILGRDAAAGLGAWVRGDEVQRRSRLVIAGRPGDGHEGGPPPGWPHEHLRAPMLDVSSTELRQRFREGRPVRYLVPDGVVRYAADHGLYGGDE